MVLKCENLLPTDLVYWCPKNDYGSLHAWYDWGGPEYREYRECKTKHKQKDLRIFCCIRKGLFHYVE